MDSTAARISSTTTDGTHLVLIIDLLLKPNFDSTIFAQCLDAILAFGNSILMQIGSNKLTILGSSTAAATVLYADPNDPDPAKSNDESSKNNGNNDDEDHGDQEDQEDRAAAGSSDNFEITGGQMEQFARITKMFRNNFASWIKQCAEIASSSEDQGNTSAATTAAASSSTSSGNKIEDGGDRHQISLLPGAISRALCAINRHRLAYADSRILIFSLSSDIRISADCYSRQYMPLINCFFAAQKIAVTLDACSVTVSRETEDSAPISASMEDRFVASILQQGCDLTGGRYIRVHKVSCLLEHLFWCFTPSASRDRPRLVLPPKLRIAPPAACFCHRKVLEIGYVCSVCVSIFCQYLPFCTTCHSNVFAANLRQIAELKRPKPNSVSI